MVTRDRVESARAVVSLSYECRRFNRRATRPAAAPSRLCYMILLINTPSAGFLLRRTEPVDPRRVVRVVRVVVRDAPSAAARATLGSRFGRSASHRASRRRRRIVSSDFPTPSPRREDRGSRVCSPRRVGVALRRGGDGEATPFGRRRGRRASVAAFVSRAVSASADASRSSETSDALDVCGFSPRTHWSNRSHPGRWYSPSASAAAPWVVSNASPRAGGPSVSRIRTSARRPRRRACTRACTPGSPAPYLPRFPPRSRPTSSSPPRPPRPATRTCPPGPRRTRTVPRTRRPPGTRR